LPTFKKNEKLKGYLSFEKVFKEGKQFFCHPLSAFYLVLPKDSNTFNEIGVAVSKKKFKRAVDRNLLKRRIRAAYQQHKMDNGTHKVQVIFLYQTAQILPFKQIEHAVVKIVKQLNHV
jgi:ribonuclease P protein component